MADIHPIVQRPVLHCGLCGSPLLFPRKHDLSEEPSPTHALAECNICAVAIQVPRTALEPLQPVHCETVEARPWPTPPTA